MQCTENWGSSKDTKVGVARFYPLFQCIISEFFLFLGFNLFTRGSSFCHAKDWKVNGDLKTDILSKNCCLSYFLVFPNHSSSKTVYFLWRLDPRSKYSFLCANEKMRMEENQGLE